MLAWLLLLPALADPLPPADGTDVVSLAAGSGHGCLLRRSGNVECWGGLSPRAFRAGEEPSHLVPRPMPDLHHVVGLAAGGTSTTCAIQADATVRCWGPDEAPRPTEGVRAVQVAIGQAHTCFVDPEGRVGCWGYNGHGQLGDGSTESASEPRTVPGLDDVRAVATGYFHTCALRRDGRVWCWGHNGSGQLGLGHTGHARSTPAPVPDLEQVVQLAAGSFHTCARVRDGRVLCWGSNNSGQLGDGTAESRPRPAAVHGIDDAIDLAVGMEHACAVSRSGAVSCWGGNEQGQIGNPRKVDHLFPTPVRGLGPVTSIAAGQEHTCALDRKQALWCWGRNSTAQLGDGSRTSRAEPARVYGY